ncbi:hypothetical protein B0H13DRAFT_2330803 [Mycena leptocephala]|nr:hypothetical protein B0H13DRAFT_2330803 [Mycena leptocephala]
MSNPLNFPHSPNSYMMEGKHRNREVASKRTITRPRVSTAPSAGFLDSKKNIAPQLFRVGWALVGFCLARALTMNPARTADAMPAGMVAIFAATITARLITLSAAAIITKIGTYYSIWRCDEVLNLLGQAEVQSLYPYCVAAGVNPAGAWVAVHASTQEGRSITPLPLGLSMEWPSGSQHSSTSSVLNSTYAQMKFIFAH